MIDFDVLPVGQQVDPLRGNNGQGNHDELQNSIRYAEKRLAACPEEMSDEGSVVGSCR